LNWQHFVVLLKSDLVFHKQASGLNIEGAGRLLLLALLYLICWDLGPVCLTKACA